MKKTLWTYECDSPKFKRKDNPDAWIKVGEENGKMFSSYPVFSEIPTSENVDSIIRYGDFVIDIDTQEIACQDAIKILDFFDEIHGISADQWRVYLSGRKGIHLELPAEVLGTEAGDTWLTLGYKRLAIEIEAGTGVLIDKSMYNRGTGKPFRRPNVMRPEGTCKRQIETNLLYEILKNKDYTEACSSPGETWEAATTERCRTLSGLMTTYLADAEYAQGIISTQAEMGAEEKEQLAAHRPECIAYLSSLQNYTESGATFNDIAMQLTASAISAGINEERFLALFDTFISNYPSTSLKTKALRVENASARYRTMLANGNQHSCGGILALKTGKRYECKSCRMSREEIDPGIKIMSAEEVNDSAANSTTDLGDVSEGLIGLGMEAFRSGGTMGIDQYAYCSIMAALSVALGGKVTLEGQWSNQYFLKVGPSSSGKSITDNMLVDSLIRLKLFNFFGIQAIASGPGLLRALSNLENGGRTGMMLDEATTLHKRNKIENQNDIEKRSVLLELYSSSGRPYSKAYVSNSNTLTVPSPCLTMIGNATPLVFDGMRMDDFHEGWIPRINIITFEGETPKIKGSLSKSVEAIDLFSAGLKKIVDAVKPGQEPGDSISFSSTVSPGSPHMLLFTPEAEECRQRWSDEITAWKNKVTEGSGKRGNIARGYEGALKMTICHHASLHYADDIFQPVSLKSMEWGIEAARNMITWKNTFLLEKISHGSFDQKIKLFMAAIKATVKRGRTPYFKELMDRRPQMRNWEMKDSESVINMQLKRGEIVTREIRGKTAYFLTKKSKK